MMVGMLRLGFVALLVLCVSPSGDVAARTSAWTLDNFEDGDLKAASGLSWIVIADDLAGGATAVELTLQPRGAERSRHALRLAGTLGAGRTSFAGAWISLERSGRNLDLSAFEGVRLRVKGPAALDVGFRSGTVNFMRRIDAGPDWSLVDVPFSSLVPTGAAAEGTRWNPAAAQLFGVTTPQAPGADDRPACPISIEIDDIAFYGSKPGVQPVASGPPTGLALVPFTPIAALPSTGWIDLGADPERDGRMPALPDAMRLEAIPSGADGRLWIRVTLREPPHDRWMGVNLLLDVDGDPANGFAWWGSNSGFKFDRSVTVWCVPVAGVCQGFIGVADAAQAAAGTLVGDGATRLKFAIDRERRTYVLGVPRDLLRLPGGDIRLVAAVGSALIYADDVPGQGAAVIR